MQPQARTRASLATLARAFPKPYGSLHLGSTSKPAGLVPDACGARSTASADTRAATMLLLLLSVALLLSVSLLRLSTSRGRGVGA